MNRGFKRLLFLMMAVFAVVVVYPVIDAEATAGDVPPIVMTPHGSKEELENKIEKHFKIDGPGGVRMHPNNTLREVSITVKNRSKASKKRERREFKDFPKNEFYIKEAKKFLSKYSSMLGIKNLEKNMQLKGVTKRKSRGNSSLSLSIYIYGYLIDNVYVRISFGSDDTIIGADFNLASITPEMISAVEKAKSNMMPVEDIKRVTGKKFVELALSKGWLINTTVDNYTEVLDFVAGSKNNGIELTDKPPYMVRVFGAHPKKNNILPQKYRGYMWTIWADVITGEVLDHRGGNYNEEG